MVFFAAGYSHLKIQGMSILNDILNRIAGKPDKRKVAVPETPGTENRVYAVATEEGVMLFSDTPKGMKARNSYLQHLADGFFNLAKVPETLRIYEMDLPVKRVNWLTTASRNSRKRICGVRTGN